MDVNWCLTCSKQTVSHLTIYGVETDKTARCSNTILLRTVSTRRSQYRYTQCPSYFIHHPTIVLRTTTQKPSTTHSFTTTPRPRRPRHRYSYFRPSNSRSKGILFSCYSGPRLIVAQISKRQHTTSRIRSKATSYPLRYYIQHHSRSCRYQKTIFTSTIW